MLFGCIHVPDFPVQAAIRHDCSDIFKSKPVVVLDGPESRQFIFSCNDAARRERIEVGASKAQLQIVPGVVMRKRRSEDEEAAQAALLDCGRALSPRVESTRPGEVIIDLSGAERLMGSPRLIGCRFVQLAAECNLHGRVGIAANPDAALHAARGFEGITIVESGKEAAALAQLPVGVLNPDPEVLESLLNWGITNFKALASLPEKSLAQRLGQLGLYLQQLARGRIERDLVPFRSITQFQESIDLEESVELLEPLSFVLNRVLGQLFARLRARSLATDHIQATFELEVHAERQMGAFPSGNPDSSVIHKKTVKLPIPSQDVRVFLKLLQLDLAAHPPMAPVKTIRVEAFPTRPRFNQVGLFQASAPEPAELEITIARLRAVVGEHDESGRLLVGFPVIKDSHKPESFDIVHLSSSEPKGEGSRPYASQGHLRVFRPPMTINVELSADEPTAVVIHGKRKKVLKASGPCCNNGAWWDEAAEWDHEEWDLTVNACGRLVYKAFRDCRSGKWVLAGRYD